MALEKTKDFSDAASSHLSVSLSRIGVFLGFTLYLVVAGCLISLRLLLIIGPTYYLVDHSVIDPFVAFALIALPNSKAKIWPGALPLPTGIILGAVCALISRSHPTVVQGISLACVGTYVILRLNRLIEGGWRDVAGLSFVLDRLTLRQRQWLWRLSPIPALLEVTSVILLFFSLLSFFLISNEILDVGTGLTFHLSMAVHLYAWHLAHLIPLLDITDSLRWAEPFPEHGGQLGALIVLFRFLMLVPVLALARDVWKRSPVEAPQIRKEGHRRFAEPEKHLGP